MAKTRLLAPATNSNNSTHDDIRLLIQEWFIDSTHFAYDLEILDVTILKSNQ